MTVTEIIGNDDMIAIVGEKREIALEVGVTARASAAPVEHEDCRPAVHRRARLTIMYCIAVVRLEIFPDGDRRCVCHGCTPNTPVSDPTPAGGGR